MHDVLRNFVSSLSLALSVYLTASLCAESYNVDAKESSISGISSGAFMTVQFHVALSGTLRGAGVTAGGKLINPLS